MVSSVGDVGAAWNDDYASKGYEYFDVWAPEIASHYGEVFWTDQVRRSAFAPRVPILSLLFVAGAQSSLNALVLCAA